MLVKGGPDGLAPANWVMKNFGSREYNIFGWLGNGQNIYLEKMFVDVISHW